jgi:putative glutamine amidotransferase
VRGPIVLSTAAEERAAPYLEALQALGVPAEDLLVVTPEDAAEAERIGAGARGLVLCGGADIDPRRYGEETLPGAGVEVTEGRDDLEWGLLAGAREARVPVWGICRGCQVLNVFLGGTLWQDLPSQRPSPIDHSQADPPELLSHVVWVTVPDAPLGERLAIDRPEVNSRHHQAVKRLAPGLMSVAESPDGLVEAFVLAGGEGTPMAPAAPANWWVRAVQWHPENLVALSEQRALWQDFLTAIR